jgi:hypothetical protein
MGLMPNKTVEDYKQRALATIRELSESGIDDLAETLRPYRIRHVENMLQALNTRAEAPDTTESERAAARRAIAEIETLFRPLVR